jgi:polyferredoxin
MLAFWTLAVAMWQASGVLIPLFMFGYIGTSVGLGLGLYGALPKKKKPLGRRLSLLMVGSFLMVVVAGIGMENMQIEGFFFGLFAGVIQAAVIHYFVAKIIGPMLFGRLWCGWACWTVMLLDLLPFKHSSGRLPGIWGWLRYAHFAISLGIVAILWFGYGYQAAVGPTALYWYVAGNAFYYLTGFILAYALKDNRAFCKYVCPITVPLKIFSRFSLLKVKGDPHACNQCEACIQTCPMDIRIPDYTRNGQRVLSTECSLCQTCISTCSREALKLSFGFDLGGKELLKVRETIGG